MSSSSEETWNLLYTEDGEPYYYNRKNSVTQWDRPQEGQIVDLVKELDRELGELDLLKGDSQSPASTSAAKEALDAADPAAAASTDTEAAPAAASAASPLPPSRAQRLENTAKWERHRTATFGSGNSPGDCGEFYYVNKETGRSQWEQPAEWISPEKRRELEAIDTDYDPSAPLSDCLAVVGVTSAAAEAERAAMLSGDADEATAASVRCEHRLQQLLGLVSSVGNEADWHEMLLHQEYKLPRSVYAYLGGGSHCGTGVTPAVRLLVGRILIIFSKLLPSLQPMLVGGQWGGQVLKTLLDHVHAGLDEAETLAESVGKDDAEEASMVWLMLIAGVLTETQEYGLDGVGEPRFLERMFDAMEKSSEAVFLEAAQVVLAMNMHLARDDPMDSFSDLPTPDSNPVMRALITHPKSEFFGEALLHLLNKHGCPYSEEGGVKLRQMLRFLQTLFRRESTAAFFFTNDLKVLVDIVIREILDLPPGDEMRLGYLRALHVLVRRSPWGEQGRYRVQDLNNALEQIANCAGDAAMLPEAVQLVHKIFDDCGEFLTY